MRGNIFVNVPVLLPLGYDTTVVAHTNKLTLLMNE